MRSVLKYGIAGGVILAVGLSFLSKHFLPDFVLTIILFPGGMMFTINDYLKDINQRSSYSYLKGVGISLAFAILAITVCHLLWLPFNNSYSFQALSGDYISTFFSLSPLLGLGAFGVPLSYLVSEKPEEKKARKDILDENF